MNIYCQFEDHLENKNLEICKYCQAINHKLSGKFISRVCPKLLETLSSNPKNTDVNLIKVTEYNKENSSKSITIDNNNKFFNLWWDNKSNLNKPYTLTTKEAQDILNSPDLLPKKEQNTKNQCTQEQIDERMSICNACEFFKNNTCLKCGCALSREQNYMNKLYYPDKSCPIGKWGPVV
jgi:hypothetical protein